MDLYIEDKRSIVVFQKTRIKYVLQEINILSISRLRLTNTLKSNELK